MIENYRPLLKRPEVLVFTKAPIFCQFDTKNSSSYQNFNSFSGFFAKPKSFLDTTFGQIIDKAKLMELVMFYHVSPQQEDDFRAENMQIIHRLQFQLASVTGTSSSLSVIPLHQVFINETPVFPSSFQFQRCVQEEDV